MKTIGILAAIVAASGGTAVAVRAFDGGDGDVRVDALEMRLAAMESSLGDLNEQLETVASLAARLQAPAVRLAEPTAAAATSTGGPAAAATPDGAAGEARGADAATAEDELDLEAFAARLRAGGMSGEEIEAMWARIAKAGKLEDAIDVMEELAELHPTDPDVQHHLGSAYIQKLMTVNDLARGVWAMKADSAFDAALALDPKHWDARFSKAISLSFWPPIMGKQPEAVKHFETLLSNQEESGYVEPKHAQTYQFLGNLYMQQGKSDKAKEIFEKGLAAFPGNTTFSDALAGL